MVQFSIGGKGFARAFAFGGFVFGIVCLLGAGNNIYYSRYQYTGDYHELAYTTEINGRSITYYQKYRNHYRFSLIQCALEWEHKDSNVLLESEDRLDYDSSARLDCDAMKSLMQDLFPGSTLDEIVDTATKAGKATFGCVIVAIIILGIGCIADILIFMDGDTNLESRNTLNLVLFGSYFIALILFLAAGLNYRQNVIKAETGNKFEIVPGVGYGLLWSAFTFWLISLTGHIFDACCTSRLNPDGINRTSVDMAQKGDNQSPMIHIDASEEKRAPNPSAQINEGYVSPVISSSPHAADTSGAYKDPAGAYTFPIQNADSNESANPFDDPAYPQGGAFMS